jgi:RHS repeat-associated protein
MDSRLFSYGQKSLDGMIHNDHLGTPQKMTDASGTVVWAADYKPFGEANITTSSIANNFRFSGQYFDQETALHYNYYRDYNPALGRYTQADPVGIIPQGPRAGLNHLYVYVWNNPIGWTDPKGLGRFPFTPPSGCEYYKKKCDEKKCPPDQYACKVYKCCKAFGDDPTANCIRGCLIAFDERNCANLTGEARNHCRQLAHWDCYDRCLGHGLGASGLLTGPPAECQAAMDEVGGMGFSQ